jgi:hypothetical protein
MIDPEDLHLPRAPVDRVDDAVRTPSGGVETLEFATQRVPQARRLIDERTEEENDDRRCCHLPETLE